MTYDYNRTSKTKTTWTIDPNLFEQEVKKTLTPGWLTGSDETDSKITIFCWVKHLSGLGKRPHAQGFRFEISYEQLKDSVLFTLGTELKNNEDASVTVKTKVPNEKAKASLKSFLTKLKGTLEKGITEMEKKGILVPNKFYAKDKPYGGTAKEDEERFLPWKSTPHFPTSPKRG